MPYLTANELVAPLGSGFQLGLGISQLRNQAAQLQEQRRHAMATEALGQEENALRAREQGIKEAEENRAAQLFQQSQAAQKWFQDQMSAPSTSGQPTVNPLDTGTAESQGLPTEAPQESPQERMQKLLPGLAARLPASMLHQLMTAENNLQNRLFMQGLDLRKEGLAENKFAETQKQNVLHPLQKERQDAEASGFTLYPNGIDPTQPDNGRDPEAFKQYVDAQRLAKMWKTTPNEVHRAQWLTANNPEFQAAEPAQQEKWLSTIVANRGLPPTIPAKELETIDKKDDQLRAARNVLALSDLTEKYGPKAFVLDKLGNLSTSLTDPEVTRVVSEFNNLKQQELRMYGARVTGPETNMVLSKIGSPFDARFRDRLLGEVSRLSEDLGNTVSKLHDQGVDVLNPQWTKRIRETWGDNVRAAQKAVTDRGGTLRPTALVLPESGKTEEPAPAATGSVQRISSKAEWDKLPSGASYIGPSGKLATKP